MKGNHVKIEMLKRNLRQTELARRLGFSLPQLNMVINGRRKTKSIRSAIARELGIPVEELFEETEDIEDSLH